MGKWQERRQRVVSAVMQGKSNQQIAAELGIKPNDVAGIIARARKNGRVPENFPTHSGRIRAHSAGLSEEQRRAMLSDANAVKASFTEEERREQSSNGRAALERRYASLNEVERRQTTWAARIEKIKKRITDERRQRRKIIEAAIPLVVQYIHLHKTDGEIMEILDISPSMLRSAKRFARKIHKLPSGEERRIGFWANNEAFREKGRQAARRFSQKQSTREIRRQNAFKQHDEGKFGKRSRK